MSIQQWWLSRDFSRPTKAKIIYHQQTGTTRNDKEIFLGSQFIERTSTS